MQASQTWLEPNQKVRKSKRELWLAVIRTVVLVALLGSAAGFLLLAFAPQWVPPRSTVQELSCPPLVVTDYETAATPLTTGASTQASTAVNDGDALLMKSGRRSLNGNQAEHRSSAKKLATYGLARNALSANRTAPREPAKPVGYRTNHKKPKSANAAPTLTQTTLHVSPFGEMHGQ